MQNEHHPELHQHFPSVWVAIVQEWTTTGANGANSDYPKLGPKQRSLLKQIKPVALVNTVAVLSAPTRWAKEEIEQELAHHIRSVLNQKLGMHVITAISEEEVDASTSRPTPQRIDERNNKKSNDYYDEHYEAQAEEEFPTSNAQLDEQEPSFEDFAEFQPGDDTLLDDIQPPLAPTTSTNTDVNTSGAKSDESRSTAADTWRAVPTRNTKTTHTPLFGNDGKEVKQAKPNAPQLNPNYTFDRFVIGSSNQFAAAACRSVAEQPAKSFNPLFLWGESGLGKTHLLHAIADYALEMQPDMRVMYVSTEELTNDFINSIANDTREAFKRRYRQLDMLIVDDIQFLERKESTQEEFFHTFNALHQAGKQIVLSSDRPPQRLTTLEDRLRTRFEGGLITDVQSPDLETRMAILTNKAKRENMNLPEDVKMLIAERYDRSIRALEGALTRVIAYCSLENKKMTVESTKIALQDILPDEVEVNPGVVIEVVAEYFGLTTEELTGKGRAKHLVFARQLAMYLCRELTELSLPKLGHAFGGRDHTTVMYAERRIREGITEDKKTFDQAQELLTRVKSRARA